MPRDVNQNPEQIARDRIDDRLRAAGWDVQDSNAIDFNAGLGIAVREYQTDIGPADYVLFADRQPVGVVEAKPDSWGARLTTVELQSEGYANAKLKWVSSAEPPPFVYESTGQVTRVSRTGGTPIRALAKSSRSTARRRSRTGCSPRGPCARASPPFHRLIPQAYATAKPTPSPIWKPS